MTDIASFDIVEHERSFIESCLDKLICTIGAIPIANKRIMPYGWRKAAKGRTVWRIVEEVISQGLEYHSKDLGFDSVQAAESEVGVYDFKFSFNGNRQAYVNIKSSVKGARTNKDDISKAEGLLDFYQRDPDANLYVATFVISFNQDMTIGFEGCHVIPTAWIPDIYVNPSNNGNLQSSHYKDLSTCIKRTPREFHELLSNANATAKAKRKINQKRKSKG